MPPKAKQPAKAAKPKPKAKPKKAKPKPKAKQAKKGDKVSGRIAVKGDSNVSQQVNINLKDYAKKSTTRKASAPRPRPPPVQTYAPSYSYPNFGGLRESQESRDNVRAIQLLNKSIAEMRDDIKKEPERPLKQAELKQLKLEAPPSFIDTDLITERNNQVIKYNAELGEFVAADPSEFNESEGGVEDLPEDVKRLVDANNENIFKIRSFKSSQGSRSSKSPLRGHKPKSNDGSVQYIDELTASTFAYESPKQPKQASEADESTISDMTPSIYTNNDDFNFLNKVGEQRFNRLNRIAETDPDLIDVLTGEYKPPPKPPVVKKTKEELAAQRRANLANYNSARVRKTLTAFNPEVKKRQQSAIKAAKEKQSNS